MNLIRYRPSSLLETIQNDLGDLLNFNQASLKSGGKWAPHVDIKIKDDKYIVLADIPGVNPKDINVTLEGNVLTIQGERTTESLDEKEGYTHSERFTGTYYRQFTLPEDIASNDITAKCDHGVLKLTIPKQQKQKESVKRIDVKSDKGE